MPTYFDNDDKAAQQIINHVGKQVFISVPLGIGKPIGLLNALYRLACHDPSIQLTIITALTLARPQLTNELEKRFVEPILKRILKDYEDPLYEIARVQQKLPKNINVIEFYLTHAAYLNNEYVQQHYISSTYTLAVRDAFFRLPINVYAQQVACTEEDANHYSLSCNSDLFPDVEQHIKAEEKKGRKIAIVAEVNTCLPYLHGMAIVNKDQFTDIIDTKTSRALFALPRDEISATDHMIGMYTSTLIKDDGCLQIGIGKISNALANALILRHNNNKIYQMFLDKFNVHEKFGEVIATSGATDIFTKGLYASTEMLSDEYLHLYREGILKKRVYDHTALQKLLNSGEISENITPDMIDILLTHKIINSALTLSDMHFLQRFGIFHEHIQLNDNSIILANGERISNDLANPETKKLIINNCLGDKLKSGKIIHAGFFLGSNYLYSQLNSLTPDELKLIDMTSIARTNKLTWDPALLALQRNNARFVNSCLMLTLSGLVVSDGINNNIEFSGVGGQFDFVSMSHQLENARSIINCRSVRQTKNGIKSNIVWEYTNFTIPRFLRDIVVTEYGIADCRAKVDADIIKSILNIVDSRVQDELLASAKSAGKISKDYRIPELFKNNYPDKYTNLIHNAEFAGYYPPYPFGSDLTEDEQVIAVALLKLKSASSLKIVLLLFKSLFVFNTDKTYERYLQRLDLVNVKSIKDFIYKKLLVYMISRNNMSS